MQAVDFASMYNMKCSLRPHIGKKWETVGIPISLGYPNLVKTNKSEFMGIKLCFPVPVDGHLKPSIFTKRKRAVLRSLRMP